MPRSGWGTYYEGPKCVSCKKEECGSREEFDHCVCGLSAGDASYCESCLTEFLCDECGLPCCRWCGSVQKCCGMVICGGNPQMVDYDRSEQIRRFGGSGDWEEDAPCIDTKHKVYKRKQKCGHPTCNLATQCYQCSPVFRSHQLALLGKDKERIQEVLKEPSLSESLRTALSAWLVGAKKEAKESSRDSRGERAKDSRRRRPAGRWNLYQYSARMSFPISASMHEEEEEEEEDDSEEGEEEEEEDDSEEDDDDDDSEEEEEEGEKDTSRHAAQSLRDYPTGRGIPSTASLLYSSSSNLIRLQPVSLPAAKISSPIPPPPSKKAKLSPPPTYIAAPIKNAAPTASVGKDETYSPKITTGKPDASTRLSSSKKKGAPIDAAAVSPALSTSTLPLRRKSLTKAPAPEAVSSSTSATASLSGAEGAAAAAMSPTTTTSGKKRPSPAAKAGSRVDAAAPAIIAVSSSASTSVPSSLRRKSPAKPPTVAISTTAATFLAPAAAATTTTTVSAAQRPVATITAWASVDSTGSKGKELKATAASKGSKGIISTAASASVAASLLTSKEASTLAPPISSQVHPSHATAVDQSGSAASSKSSAAIFLNVPFTRKDEAKSFGARWNPLAKKWWIDSAHDNQQKLVEIFGAL